MGVAERFEVERVASADAAGGCPLAGLRRSGVRCFEGFTVEGRVGAVVIHVCCIGEHQLPV